MKTGWHKKDFNYTQNNHKLYTTGGVNGRMVATVPYREILNKENIKKFNEIIKKK